MKNLITYLSKKSLSLGNGSGMTRKWFGNDSGMTRLCLASLICLFMLTVGVGNAWGAATLVSTLSGISSGDTYYIAALNSSNYYTVPNTTISGQTFTCTSGTYNSTTQVLTPATGAGEFVFTAKAGTDNAYYIYNTNLKKYLVATGSKTFGYVESSSSDYGYWTFSTVTGGGFSGVFSVKHSNKTHYMRAYNNSVRCYDGARNNGIYLFKKSSGYSITYHCNGATSGCPSNASSQTALPSTLPTPTRTGCTFAGWYTNEGLTSAATAGATLSANADLYAKWTCNVTLNRNGATETINNVVVGTALDDIDGTGAQGGCSEWTFEGWSKTQRAAQNNSATMDLVTTVDGPGPYYAVYSHTESGGGETTVSMNSFSSTSGDVEVDENVSYEAAQGSASTAPAIISNEIRIYQNGGLLTITANNGVKLTTITIGSSMATSVSYSVDGGTASSNQSISANGTYTLEDIEADEVVFTCKGTDKNSRLYLNSLSVTYSGGSTTYYSTTASCCTDPGLAYGTGSVTKTFGDAVFTNTLTNSHSVAVTYSSSDETVATVNGSGQVTILKAGST